MATRNRLSMAGSSSALLETLDAFKRKHVSQNKDIIKRNMELMKLNTDLNKRLRDLQQESLSIKCDNVRLSERVAAAENQIVQSSQHSRPSLQGLEDLRQALAVIISQAQQANTILSPASGDNSRPDPSASVLTSKAATLQESTSDQLAQATKKLSLSDPNLPQRIQLAANPDLSLVDEGSVEMDEAARRSPHTKDFDSWRRSTNTLLRNPLANSTSPASSPPSSPEAVPSSSRLAAVRASAGAPVVRAATEVLEATREGSSSPSPEKPVRPRSNKPSKRASRRASMALNGVNLLSPPSHDAGPLPSSILPSPSSILHLSSVIVPQDSVSPVTDVPKEKEKNTALSIVSNQASKAQRRRTSALHAKTASTEPDASTASQKSTPLPNRTETVQDVEARALQRISNLMQARKEAALVLGQVTSDPSVDEDAQNKETAQIDALAATVSRRRKPLTAMPLVPEENRERVVRKSNKRGSEGLDDDMRGTDQKILLPVEPEVPTAAFEVADQENLDLPGELSNAVGRRSKKAVNYALPNLRDKMRQPAGYVPAIKKPSARYSHSVVNSAAVHRPSLLSTPKRPSLTEEGLSSLPRRKSSTFLATLASPDRSEDADEADMDMY